MFMRQRALFSGLAFIIGAVPIALLLVVEATKAIGAGTVQHFSLRVQRALTSGQS